MSLAGRSESIGLAKFPARKFFAFCKWFVGRSAHGRNKVAKMIRRA